jgi:hypothetical protein
MVDRAAPNGPTYSLHRSDRQSTSQLLVDDHETSEILLGQWLEAQYATAAGALLFIVDDAYQEDALGIYLLDPQHRVRDHIRLQRMYATGKLRGLRQLDEANFEFSFLGDDLWRLQVLSPPRAGLHLPFPLREQHRDHLFSRHWLALRKQRPNA